MLPSLSFPSTAINLRHFLRKVALNSSIVVALSTQKFDASASLVQSQLVYVSSPTTTTRSDVQPRSSQGLSRATACLIQAILTSRFERVSQRVSFSMGCSPSLLLAINSFLLYTLLRLRHSFHPPSIKQQQDPLR